MVRGWYTGASGMNAQQYRLDAISNNLANVDTTGFKRDIAVSKNFPELLLRRMNDDGVYKNTFGSADAAPIIGKIGLGVEVNELFTNFEQGSFKQTGNDTDMALEGHGFFAVETPHGERYTRNGNFTIGVEGYLLTKEGYPVLGENGRIFLQDTKFTVNKNGEVYARPIADTDADPVLVDRMKLVVFENDRYLAKQGSSLYRETPVSGPAFSAEGNERPVITQGFVEASNVNVVNEMVQMIEVNRMYEANQKTIQTEDTMMSKLWSEVVRVR
ncbi:flagellar basal-body rod protein FlgF [Brucepastera parasyntrophica]|uniref:flagellar basal-body rod protein FlgF n=1 Tax=Brucepastera parasyntrophica TaxID=2880008 RepID=UPI00210B12E7|nr:flagellar basal-body rod protein FlgF [Brucepastera parasyntrophica]ULQ60073.1 flagellar basal-body rod protein FlgF [Brucepastera parasyntrophica]